MSGTVEVRGDELVFEIHGFDEFLALKRTLTVPLAHVVSCSTEPPDASWWRGMKVAGTRIPGIVKDGRFLTRGGLMFFEEHDPAKCITVMLDHERYKGIIFEVADKEATAKEIRASIGLR